MALEERHRRRAAGAPRIGLPGQQGAIFLGGHFDLRPNRRTASSQGKFRVTLQHDAHRLTAGLLRELRRIDAPAIRPELAAEAAADVILVHGYISARNVQSPGVLTRYA